VLRYGRWRGLLSMTKAVSGSPKVVMLTSDPEGARIEARIAVLASFDTAAGAAYSG
jgi:hypothetical protein